MRVGQFADQRSLVEKEVRVQLAACRILEDFRESDLDRHLALGEGIVAQIDRCRRAASDFANQIVFADLIHVGRAFSQTTPGAHDSRANLVGRGAAEVIA